VDIRQDQNLVHIAEFNPELNEIWYRETHDINKKNCKLYAEFSGFSDEDYTAWFKDHRKKKKLLPVFKVGDSSLMIWLKEKWVLLRGTGIDLLVLLRIKSLKRNVG
jgi:hypothetical protein